MTNIPSNIELHDEIDKKLGKTQQRGPLKTTRPSVRSAVKNGNNGRQSTSVMGRTDDQGDLTPKRYRHNPSAIDMTRSVSAINIRKDFVDNLPPPITKNRPKPVKSPAGKSQITNIRNITPNNYNLATPKT